MVYWHGRVHHATKRRHYAFVGQAAIAASQMAINASCVAPSRACIDMPHNTAE
jgi:hypothetical protein